MRNHITEGEDGFEILLLQAVFETSTQGLHPHFFELFGPCLIDGRYIAIELLEQHIGAQDLPVFGFVGVWCTPAAAGS